MGKFKRRFTYNGNTFRISKIFSYGMSYEAFCKGFIEPEKLIDKSVKLIDCENDIEYDYKIINVSNNIISYDLENHVKRTYITLAQNRDSEIFRQVYFSIQRLMRGFDGSNLWSLDSHLTDLLVERFKRFKKAASGHGWPILDKNKNVTYVDGGKISQKILDGFLILQKLQTNNFKATQHELEMVNHAFNLFSKHFNDFWT